jgi:hypothetical protein
MKMKKLGIWLLALSLFATHVCVRSLSAEELPSWKSMTTRTNDCQIAFPAQPQLIQQALKVSEQGHMLTYDIYLAPLHKEALCLLLVATYPLPVAKGNELAGLEGLLNGILGHNPDSKVVFANVVDHHGHTSVDFLIQSSTSYFRGKTLMVGNKLFLLAIEGKAGQLDEKAFKHFSGSFALIP